MALTEDIQSIPVSSNEILDFLKILYKTTNENRELTSLQSHEVVCLLNPENLRYFLSQVITEIRELEGEEVTPSYDDCFDWLSCRGLLQSQEDISLDSLNDQTKSALIYDTLSELTAARIQMKTIKRSTIFLIAPKPSKFTLSIRSALEKLMNKIDSSTAPPSQETSFSNLSSSIQKLSMSLTSISSPSGPFHALLLPTLTPAMARNLAILNRIADSLNSDYQSRREVILCRLDATLGSFLWSKKAQNSETLNKIVHTLDSSLEIRSNLKYSPVYLWDAFSATRELLAEVNSKISSAPVQSFVRTVTIGHVPDRGGVPEGYTNQDVKDDVRKANQQLQQKGAREAAALIRSAKDRNLAPPPRSNVESSYGATTGASGVLPPGGNPWSQAVESPQRNRIVNDCYDTSGRFFSAVRQAQSDLQLLGEDVENQHFRSPVVESLFLQAAPAPQTPYYAQQQVFTSSSNFGGREQDRPASAYWLRQGNQGLL